MAIVKIELKCAKCGNTFTHRHECYNRAAAESYQEWAINNIDTCPECYHAEKRETEKAERAEAVAAAATALSDAGVELVQLTGSYKQIAWAADIRAKICGKAAVKNPKPEFWKLVNSHAEAKWWIDNRDSAECLSDFVKLLKRA